MVDEKQPLWSHLCELLVQFKKDNYLCPLKSERYEKVYTEQFAIWLRVRYPTVHTEVDILDDAGVNVCLHVVQMDRYEQLCDRQARLTGKLCDRPCCLLPNAPQEIQ